MPFCITYVTKKHFMFVKRTLTYLAVNIIRWRRGQDSGNVRKKPIFTHLKKRFEHIELPAKLLDYFSRSNKSNINQSGREVEGRTGGWVRREWDWIEQISCAHVGKVSRTHAFSCCHTESIKFWWDRSESYNYFLGPGVCVGCPCPKIESSEVGHKAMDCKARS